MKKILPFLLILSNTFLAQAQLNLTFISNQDYPTHVNDVWGYTAPDGTEYALVGIDNGVSILSLADPADPTPVAFVLGDNSFWRDIKTWGTFAYVTADQGNDGLTIIDLSNLPNSVTSTKLTSLPTGTLTTCHNLYIDENGYAYLAGCNLNGGGMIFLDCFTDPSAPSYAGIGPNVYAHDVYARDNKMYSSEIGQGQFSIYDVSDKNNVVKLGSQSTPSSGTHNTWLSDDGNILFTTDEVSNAPVAAYDVSDPTDIQFLDQYAPFETLGEGVSPHNVHVWENWLIVSYYEDGVILIDATFPDNLVEVGNFDTYIPATTGFQGAWGVYPYLPSGLVLVSDQGTGLYVLQPNYVQACYLEGEVTNAVSGVAIPGAHVSLLATSTFTGTDAFGEFKTGIATSGTYEVEVSNPGFESATATVILTNGEITVISVELTPLPSFMVSGMVVKAGSIDPVPNAKVNITNDLYSFQATADASGNFSIPEIFDDTYDVFAGLWGYKTNLLEAEDLNENNNSIVIEVEEGLEDIFSVDLGWTVSANTNNGTWERGVPIAVTAGPGFIITPPNDVPEDIGNHCYVTGNEANLFSGFLTDGSTTLTSPVFDLTTYNEPRLRYNYWYLNADLNNNGNSGQDQLIVSLNNGVDEVIIAEHNSGGIASLSWRNNSDIIIDSFILPTNNMTFSIEVISSSSNLGTEAGLDFWQVLDANPVAVNNPIDQNIRIGIYPNPSNLTFQMEYDLNGWSGHADVVVTNVLGQTVDRLPLSSPVGTTSFGSDLPKGIFFMQIKESNRRSRVIKLVKE